MAEHLFSTFDISGQGLSVQRMRLNAVAKNIANANTTHGPDGEPYKREVVRVTHIPGAPFDDELDEMILMDQTTSNHAPTSTRSGNYSNYRVLNAEVQQDNSPPRLIYDPNHPDANEEGYIEMPNINIVTEMVEMISAQRAFEANTGVIDSAKNIARYSLEI